MEESEKSEIVMSYKKPGPGYVRITEEIINQANDYNERWSRNKKILSDIVDECEEILNRMRDNDESI